MKAQIFNHRHWLCQSIPTETLREILDNMLKNSGFNVLGFMEHHFKPQGYTAIWLLAESHLALHTFPENNRSYIELSSCNLEKHNHFVQSLSRWEEQQRQAI